jgi:hypothetical protein
LSARLSFPDQHLPIKLELQLDVLAPSFFDAIAERPLTSRRSRRSPVRREGRSQTLHEQLALAIELLKLRLSRPPPDLRGDGCYDAFVLLRPDAVAQMLELRDHVAPETLSSGAADRVVAGDAAQECDVLLPWLTVDADALDQNGFKARSLSPPRDERLRSVSLPSNNALRAERDGDKTQGASAWAKPAEKSERVANRSRRGEVHLLPAPSNGL